MDKKKRFLELKETTVLTKYKASAETFFETNELNNGFFHAFNKRFLALRNLKKILRNLWKRKKAISSRYNHRITKKIKVY
jgi:hypothetical protein